VSAAKTVAFVRCRLIGHDSAMAGITPDMAATIRDDAAARGLSDVAAIAVMAPVTKYAGTYLIAPVEDGCLDVLLGDAAVRHYLSRGVASVALFANAADYAAMCSAYRGVLE
jgi:hypothetical protein